MIFILFEISSSDQLPVVSASLPLTTMVPSGLNNKEYSESSVERSVLASLQRLTFHTPFVTLGVAETAVVNSLIPVQVVKYSIAEHFSAKISRGLFTV